MEPDLSDVDEVTTALDYLADQSYTPEQMQLIAECLIPIQIDYDLDKIKDDFAGLRGVITRLRIILQFAKKYETNEELMQELQSEMQYLLASMSGGTSSNFSL